MKTSEQNYIRFLIRECLEEMSGFHRIRKAMLGLEASINTIGIISAENPMARKLTPQENNIRMNRLKETIRRNGLGFVELKGKYIHNEKSLFVPNIERELNS